MFAAKWNRGLGGSGKRSIPAEMLGAHPHTHNALDDAIGQAQLFSNIRLTDARKWFGVEMA